MKLDSSGTSVRRLRFSRCCLAALVWPAPAPMPTATECYASILAEKPTLAALLAYPNFAAALNQSGVAASQSRID